jgi:hypothetical protein
LVLSAWSSAALAAEPTAPPPTASFPEEAPLQPPPASSTERAQRAPVVAVADGQRRTALVGFQTTGHRARLETKTLADGSTSPEWHVVCEAPCTRSLSLDGTFRTAGDGFAPSEPFQLPKNKEHLTVTSHLEKNRAARTVPIVLIATGLFSFAVVAPILLIAETESVLLSDQSTTAAPPTGAAVFLLGGLAVATVGVVWLLVVSGEKRSVVNVASRPAPRLELPGGVALESRGLTF